MKKIILLLCLLLSLAGYSQVEGFESTSGPEPLPSTNWPLGSGDWAVFDNGIGTNMRWGITTTASQVYQGANSAYMNRDNTDIGQGNTAEDYLATPMVTVPTNGQLHFWTKSFQVGNQGTFYQIKVAVAPNPQTNPGSYVLAQQWTEAQLSTTFNIYEEKVVDLSLYAGLQVYIAFVMVNTQGATPNSDRWFVDNVNLVEQCFATTAVTAGSITQTSATLSWTGTAPQYEIEIIPSTGTFTGIGTIINTNSFVATATTAGVPFTANTAYSYRVRAICSSDNTSVWAGPYTFNTSRPGLSCSSPIAVTTLPYSTTDNTSNYSDNPAIEGSPGASGCGSTNNYLGGNDVVYAYTADTNGIINIMLTPSATSTNTGIFVYSSCANVGVNCMAGVANTTTAIRTFDLPVTAGTTYYIVISSLATTQTAGYTLVLQRVSCPPPTTLSASNIGISTAQLSWANPGGATSWEVALQNAGSPIPTGSGVTANTNVNFPVGSLNVATTYQYYVRADCGDGTFSIWAGPYLFHTALCDVAQQCNYSFVVRDSDGDGWNGGTMQVRQNGIVVATLTGPTAAQGTNPVTVSVTMCDGMPYDLFWNTAGGFPAEMGVTIINSFAQTLFVKAPGTGTPATILYSDTVSCLVPACLPPTNLTVTNIANTSATLGWTTTGPETSWQVIALPQGSTAPLSTATGWVAAPTNPFIITDLLPATFYDFYVRPVCSPTSIGQWSAARPFNTTVCALADQCNYSFIMRDSDGDGWNNGTMQVRQNGIVVATLTGPTAAQGTNPITVTVALCHGVPFDLFWNNGGGYPGEMGISIRESLAPQNIIYNKPSGTGTAGTILYASMAECFPATCPKPNTLAVSNIGPASATVSWIEAGTATQWEILILSAGSPFPLASATGILTTSNPYTFSTLAGATSYDVYIRAVCSPTDSSFWSNKATFTTLIANDECIAATIAPVNVSTTCTLTASGSLLGATASSQPNSCGGTDDDDVWFQFTATSTQHTISLLNVSGSTTDLYHVLYTGSCGSLTQLSCNDVNNSTANNLTVGQVYYIRVYSYTSSPNQNTTFNLCIGTPVPPPTCINNDPAGNTCATATPICNLNGYCGSTSDTYTADYWSELGNSFCGSIENNSFLSFVATSTSISFDVWVTSSTDNNGIQILIFSATNCSGPINNLSCWSPGVVPEGSTNISANGLVVGNSYYIMIDGYSGDVCDYVIAANSGIQTQVNLSASATTICLGESVDLAATGGNGSYVWTPATGLSSTTGSNVTFTPTSTGTYTITATSNDGILLCPQDVSASKTIIVNSAAATFPTFGPYCSGAVVPALPTTSDNGIIGVWSPPTINNTLSGSYTFTPNAGQCAAALTVPITINNTITPVFSFTTSYCYGATVAILPTTSDNGVTGTWSPSVIDNTQFGNYTFTPASGQCSEAVIVPVTVNTLTTPTFLAPAPICSGTPAPVLPTTSLNGITGTWLPATVSNTASGAYTFTPTAGQCANPTTLNIEVLQNCSFGSFASAVWLTDCDTNDFFNTVGSGASLIGPVQNVFPNVDLGTYLSYSNTFKLRGAEVKTFKINTANVCSARLNYRIYPQSGTPGAFTVLDLPFYDECNSGTFPTGGPCAAGDQKWQRVLTDSQSPIDLTAFAPGDYVIEAYYDVTGDVDSTTQCDDTIYINNNGANYIANYTLQASPTYTFTNPTSCNAIDGSITITGLAPNTSYSLTYTDDTVATGPITIMSNVTGEFVLNGLNAGTYANFSFVVNACTITSLDVIVLTDQLIIPTFTAITICNGDTSATLPTSSLNGITGNWSPATIDNTQTLTYTFTPDAGQCATNGSLTVTVSQPTAATFNAIPSICAGGTAPTLPATSLQGFTGSWSPTVVDTAQSGTYTFTPTAGQCATTGSVAVTVIQNVTPTFAFGTLITACAGFSPQVLITTTSQEGITGTWSPSTIDYSAIGTTTYTFTPTIGLCALNATLTVIVTDNTTPTFTPVQPICAGAVLTALPTTSNNGYTGTWSPALNNAGTTTYTFAPTAGLCALQTTLSITVIPNVTPTFSPIATLCIGETAPSLPSSSIEGVTGTWSPTTISNTESGIYVFTPNAGQCSGNGALSVTVQSGFDFEITDRCIGNDFTLEVVPVNESFDSNLVNYVWHNSSMQTVGTNSFAFNVTEYLASTPASETLPMDFSVTVTTADGCYKSKPITLTRVYCGIQKGISVNHDGKNEFFDLIDFNVKELNIFNRYGMKVYSKSGYTNQWVGQSDKGDELPDGTYYYVIDFNDAQATKTGWIYLNRVQ